MCGVFGSRSYDRFVELAKLNLYRGGSTYSITQFDRDGLITDQVKTKGVFDFRFVMKPETWYIVGHVQAPTTTHSNIHPCVVDESMLWHNGIIKEYYLKEKGWDGWDTEYLCRNIDSLSDINGSFACVYYNSRNRKLTTFRNEIAPLFIDDTMSLSSVKFEDSYSLPPNRIYLADFNRSKWISTDNTFETKENPYYFGD